MPYTCLSRGAAWQTQSCGVLFAVCRRWLGLTAFMRVLRRKQTAYTALLVRLGGARVCAVGV